MDELVIDNLVYIPSKRAAAITGYAKDYIGQLCREGRIEAKLVGRSWYVLESSVREHRFGTTGNAASAPEVAPEANTEPLEGPVVAVTEGIREEAPPAIEDQPMRTWEAPAYTAEPVQELIESRQPTYLESTTPQIKPVQPVTQIEEVQNAWQEWFSKNETTTPPREELVPIEDTPSEEPVEAREEIVEEEARVPLKVTRSYAGSMDIAPEPPRQPARAEHHGRVVTERVVRRKPRSGVPSVALKAVFIGIIILTLAVTVVGTGSLDALSPTWASKSGAIDYLAGVGSVEK